MWSIWETGFLTDSSSKLDWMFLTCIHWWSWSWAGLPEHLCSSLGFFSACVPHLFKAYLLLSHCINTQTHPKEQRHRRTLRTLSNIRRCPLGIAVGLLPRGTSAVLHTKLPQLLLVPRDLSSGRCGAWVSFSGANVSVPRDYSLEEKTSETFFPPPRTPERMWTHSFLSLHKTTAAQVKETNSHGELMDGAQNPPTHSSLPVFPHKYLIPFFSSKRCEIKTQYPPQNPLNSWLKTQVDTDSECQLLSNLY